MSDFYIVSVTEFIKTLQAELLLIYEIFMFLSLQSQKFKSKYDYCKICINSLIHNHHMSQSYAADVCLEPIVWIVDNFTHLLGPVNHNIMTHK